jgi:hypothetical protein
MKPMKYVAAEGQFWGEIRMWGDFGEYNKFRKIKAKRMIKIAGR